MHQTPKTFLTIGGIFAALALTGCQTLPDLQPFADSTAQLAASVRASGKSTVADLRTLAARYDADATKADKAEASKITQDSVALKKSAEDLEKAWSENSKMIDATVAYADSLAQIAAAGKSGEESVKKVGDSLKTLLDSVGTVVPGMNTVFDIGGRIYAQIAEVRAARNLESALAAAQPAVDGVARILDANFASLAQTNHNLSLELVTTNEDDTRAGFAVPAERSVLKLALAAHDELRKDVQTALKINIPAPTQPDDARAAALKNREATLKVLAGQSQQLEDLIAASRAKLAPVDAAVAAAEEKAATQAKLLVAAQTAVGEWAAYHRRLLAGIHEKHAPSAAALSAAASDVRDLLNLFHKKS